MRGQNRLCANIFKKRAITALLTSTPSSNAVMNGTAATKNLPARQTMQVNKAKQQHLHPLQPGLWLTNQAGLEQQQLAKMRQQHATGNQVDRQVPALAHGVEQVEQRQ